MFGLNGVKAESIWSGEVLFSKPFKIPYSLLVKENDAKKAKMAMTEVKLTRFFN